MPATRQPQRLETTQEGGDKMSVAIRPRRFRASRARDVVIVMHETTELRYSNRCGATSWPTCRTS